MALLGPDPFAEFDNKVDVVALVAPANVLTPVTPWACMAHATHQHTYPS